MMPTELGQLIKQKNPGVYDQYPDEVIGQRLLVKYPQYRSGLNDSHNPDPQKDPLNFERSSKYPPSRMTDVSVPDAMVVDAAVKAPMAAYGLGKAGISGVKALAGKVGAIRNAPQVLEEALGTATEQFGTRETPSMIGNTARAGLDSEQALNEALAQKLYSSFPKDVPASTPRLSARYQEIADELPPSIGNAIKKNIQIGENPIRPNDIGTTNTKIFGQVMPEGRPVIPHQYTASPGVPSQLPPNTPPVGELIKLRSKLGAASKMGGIDGHNAGELKGLLDEDIANLGSGEGPLGQMTNEAVVQPLKRATSYYREMMGQQNTPLYKKLATSKVEDIPDIIFKNGRTQDVLEARAALGEQGYQAAKKSFFNDIINSKDVSKTLGKYKQSNSDFLSAAFNPKELMSLETVAGLQQKAVEAAKTVARAKKLIVGAGTAATVLEAANMMSKRTPTP